MNWRDLARYDEGFTEYGENSPNPVRSPPNMVEISMDLAVFHRSLNWKTIILRRIGWFSWSGRLARVLEEQFRF